MQSQRSRTVQASEDFPRGLHKETSLHTFTKHYGKYGEIIDSVIRKDKLTGLPRGFGFTTYVDPSVVDKVIADTHGINGRQVEIKITILTGVAQSKDFKTKKIMVGGNPSTLTDDDLHNFFSEYGKVEIKKVIMLALVQLKKGTHLIKYSRKGKPKLRPFRVSSDETTLIWHSQKKERSIKLASVAQITPGQRTAVFRRFLRPEKDYLSFSLLYNNGERSLDLDGGDYVRTGHPYGATLGSDVRSERANMQLRSSNGDSVRLSVSSAPSSSSQGSGPDDIESLGDVYVWGEIWCDGILPDGSTNALCSKTDALLPKPLESNVVLDVQQIACGVRHAALVTRQGEVFSWGEEFGGRLGHGNDRDVNWPRLVESLAVWNMDYVTCGEYHTCAISTAGDLFAWGDGAHNTGLLGHGTNVSHWIPKRVSGLLEGLQVLSVACGTWHTALSTSNGKAYTFGDGTFGVLGHGDRESVEYPWEVESLNGLRTIKIACGVWHTAAIVEVMGQLGVNVISRKLFTWGDGEKNRLGHGDKEARLVPTCVSSLIDYNFHQLACGHTMTVALTASGRVFTMGSNIHGQVGNLQADGRTPSLVQDRLVGELVEEIACGAYHVAVLTSRSEVYTWGKGANGRLGHGDTEDRKIPILVEALKDRHVKSISCGSNFTACICIHKWVSGADQLLCSGCRQAFGFTRKIHNCYNCGLVHCHSCSSRKVLKAALAPIPGKPHRVCDSCYSKLKAAEVGNAFNAVKKNIIPLRSIDIREKSERGETKSSRLLLSPSTEPVKYVEIKSVKNEMKTDPLSLIRASQVPSLLQLKDISFPSPLSALQTAWRPVVTSGTPPQSRPTSPYARKPSPPPSVAPVFSKGIIDSLKKTNEVLNQEVIKLQTQIELLKQRCDNQDESLRKSEKKAEEAAILASEESSRCNVAVEVIKSLGAQLNDIADTVPPEVSDDIKSMHIQAETLLRTYGSRTSEDSSTFVVDSSEIDRSHVTNEGSMDIHDQTHDHTAAEGGRQNSKPAGAFISGATSNQSMENGSRYRNAGETKLIEQFEPGVYVTLVQLRNGTKVFKRVRFSKRRFAEQQAEEWWKHNQERVFKKYNYPIQSTSSTSPSSAPAAEEEEPEPSSNG